MNDHHNVLPVCILAVMGISVLACGQTPTPYLEVPEYTASGGSGAYTGFNSLNLQEIYIVQKQAAVRSQIGPFGGHKPCLAMLPNGDLLATQRVGGNVTLCRSKDGGFSWGPPREVIISGVEGLSENWVVPGRAAQLSALADGTLLMAAEWIKQLRSGKLFRSTDEGQTWQDCRIDWSVTLENKERKDFIFGETDGFHEMADGTVICSAYVELAPGRPKAYLLRSKDGGKTWGDGSYIADASEVNIAVLPGDKLFGCLRVATGDPPSGEGGAMPMVVDSSDGGRTWSKPRAIGLGRAQVPGYPVYLKDGRLLLMYGNRQFPFGAQAIASLDGGKTWDTEHPIILVWSSWDNYCGMPRSLVLPDGTILTGYYAHMFRDKPLTGYSLRWKVPDNWPEKWPPTPVPLMPPAGKEPYLEVPEYKLRVKGVGDYSGFNSLNLQEIYFVQKQAAVRSQISPPGGHKPCLAMLPNGDLLATQRVGRNAALCRSKDDGLSWSPPREVIIRGVENWAVPGRVAQLSALADGTLLMAAEWIKQLRSGKLFRSTDEGRTWQDCRIDWSVTLENKERKDFIFGESNGPHQLSNGTVICDTYIELVPGRPKAYLLRSTDGGQTWGDGSYIADASEVNIAVLPGGRLFACLRVATGDPPAGEGGARLAVTESSDGGRSWSRPRWIEGVGKSQIPGFPVYLEDGRLIIVHGNRQFPFGAQAIASRDGGQTWDTEHPIFLTWFSWDNYCGHPRSLVRSDGSIVTGYYARIFLDKPLVGHSVRWRVPDDWPPLQ